MRVVILSILLIAADTVETTIERIGNSCNVCKISDDMEVCRHYERCPIPKKKGEE